MIGDVLALYEFLQKRRAEYKIISALFDAEGNRKEGDSRIEVRKILPSNNPEQWFYNIKSVDDFVFIYMPVIPSVYVDYGIPADKKYMDANFFRFVGTPISAVMGGRAQNVAVDFLVVGYKPKDLLSAKVGKK